MYRFEAHYIDVVSGVDIIKEIEFNPGFFPTRKDCYLYAMERACGLEEKEEAFHSLELVSS